MQKAMQYAECFSRKSYLFVTYEHLVLEQQKTIKKICKKFDIKYDSSMLDDSKFKSMHGNKWKSNTVYNDKVSGIYTNGVNKWKSELSRWEVLLTELIMGELMDKFGYKRIGVKKGEDLMDQMICEVCKSQLVSEGMVRFLLTKKGFERYPADPQDKKFWAKTAKK